MEERTLFQKILLAVLAGMILVFGIITAVNQSRPGIVFREDFLRKEAVTDADAFTEVAPSSIVVVSTPVDAYSPFT